MTSDFPDDLGFAQPGLDQLLRTLTSAPTADELAGEGQALAMFRANVHPPAAGTVPMPAGPARRTGRPRRIAAPAFRLRIAAGATAAALVGGFAAAAYAAALPAPVQHVVYDALHRIGVPDSQHHPHSGGGLGPGAGLHPSLHPSPGGSAGHRTAPASRPAASPHPTTSRSGGPHPSVSPSGTATTPPGGSTGTAAITASASAAQIPAGTPVTISGQLTRAGKAVAGVTVTLWERPAGQLAWHRAGKQVTSSAGSVAVTVASLKTNATFRFTDRDGRASGPAVVTVVPGISTSLTTGSRRVNDYFQVSTQYAQSGDTVRLQEYEAGSWVTIRTRQLNAAGQTTFVLAAKNFTGLQLRAVLAATRLHARAVSSQVAVPPPSRLPV
jgi:hypothetical protein